MLNFILFFVLIVIILLYYNSKTNNDKLKRQYSTLNAKIKAVNTQTDKLGASFNASNISISKNDVTSIMQKINAANAKYNEEKDKYNEEVNVLSGIKNQFFGSVADQASYDASEVNILNNSIASYKESIEYLSKKIAKVENDQTNTFNKQITEYGLPNCHKCDPNCVENECIYGCSKGSFIFEYDGIANGTPMLLSETQTTYAKTPSIYEGKAYYYAGPYSSTACPATFTGLNKNNFTACGTCFPGECYYTENLNSSEFVDTDGTTKAPGTTPVTLIDFPMTNVGKYGDTNYGLLNTGICAF